MRKRVFFIFSALGIILLFLIFWVKGVTYLDPDFGWHLKMGEYILAHGIPKTDPFSYTMPSFPSIDHEWLTDVVIFRLYSIFGKWGLSLIFSALTLAALLVSLPKGLNKWSLIPLLLSVTIIIPFIGIRPQVETWFLIAILLKVIFDEILWKKWRFVIPFMFVVWVNLHGGFALGIAALFIILGLRSWQKKKLVIKDLTILLTSVLATFLNPYGMSVWREVWMTMSDSSLRWSIQEWTPSFFKLDPAYLFFLAFSSLIIWRYRRKLRFPKVALIFILALAGISSQRHIPLWLMAALPATVLCLQYFYEEIKNNSFSVRRFNLIYKILLVVVMIVLANWIFLSFKDSSWNESTKYPSKATDFLRSRQQDGHIFSDYSWGGYLIWKLPEEKVFIDGRMPSWRWTSSNPDESNWAFKEYKEVLYEKEDFSGIFSKYNIKTVLWETQKKENKQNSILEKWQNQLTEFMFGKEPVKPLPDRLLEAGWKVIYRDNIATIYQKI